MFPSDSPSVDERALRRNAMPSRLQRMGRSFDMGASSFVFSKYGGTAAFTIAEMGLGGDPTGALATGAGFAASQLAYDTLNPMARATGKAMGGAGKRLSNMHTMMPKANAFGRAASMAARGGGGLARAGGALLRGGPVLAAAALVGMMFPDKHPMKETSDYLMGIKFGEWAKERTHQIKLEKKGGFGITAPLMNNERVINARNIAKTLIGQSSSMSMLGNEASYMHN